MLFGIVFTGYLLTRVVLTQGHFNTEAQRFEDSGIWNTERTENFWDEERTERDGTQRSRDCFNTENTENF